MVYNHKLYKKENINFGILKLLTSHVQGWVIPVADILGVWAEYAPPPAPPPPGGGGECWLKQKTYFGLEQI